MPTPFSQQPSVKTLQTLAYRNIYADPATKVAAPIFAQLDGTNSRDTFNAADVTVIEAGMPIGKITATGLYRPTIIGITGASYTSGGTSITVSAAVAAEVARLIANNAGPVNLSYIGPPAAAGVVATTTVAASAASGTTITTTTLGVNLVIGSIIAPADGSAIPLTITDYPYGMPVTLTDGSAVNQFLAPYISGGDIATAMILGYSSMDTSVQAYIKTKLALIGTFRFSDNR